MRWRALTLLLWAIAPGAQAAIGVCDFYRDAYQGEIKAKIQAGVPFELMSVIVSQGQVVEKKAVRVAYNLWDEVITVKAGEQTLARIPVANGASEVCKYLELEAPAGRSTYRLLLNPLWAERVARLQVAAGESDSGRLVGINWHKLASDVPSDKVLLEREITR